MKLKRGFAEGVPNPVTTVPVLGTRPILGGQPLCFRCECRARYLETGEGPRFECQNIPNSVSHCYSYRPTMPLTQIPDKGEKRPIGEAWMFSGRAHAKLVDAMWRQRRWHHEDNSLDIWWEPVMDDPFGIPPPMPARLCVEGPTKPGKAPKRPVRALSRRG